MFIWVRYDVLLLAPSVALLQRLLQACEEELNSIDMVINGIVIQWYVAPYTDNTEWYVALMLAAGVWGGVGGA